MELLLQTSSKLVEEEHKHNFFANAIIGISYILCHDDVIGVFLCSECSVCSNFTTVF